MIIAMQEVCPVCRLEENYIQEDTIFYIEAGDQWSQFDLSMPEILDENGIHTHLVSDHTHYWEDGGGTYHTRYSTWEGVRGQEGDPWKGIVGEIEDVNPNLIQHDGYRGKLYRQNNINRTFMQEESKHPQVQTFQLGLEFMERNRHKDNWFLQIETFDPHEPFFSLRGLKNYMQMNIKGRVLIGRIMHLYIKPKKK